MKNHGFSLIELLIVIALIGILLAIAVPNYNETMTKTKIEAQTKELHSASTNARLAALQNKQLSSIKLSPTSYVFGVYTGSDYSTPSGFKEVTTVSLPFVIQKKVGGGLGDISGYSIDFDTRGFTIDPFKNNMTIVVTPVKYGGGDNCIVVYTTRTNIGRMDDASTCTTR